MNVFAALLCFVAMFGVALALLYFVCTLMKAMIHLNRWWADNSGSIKSYDALQGIFKIIVSIKNGGERTQP